MARGTGPENWGRDDVFQLVQIALGIVAVIPLFLECVRRIRGRSQPTIEPPGRYRWLRLFAAGALAFILFQVAFRVVLPRPASVDVQLTEINYIEEYVTIKNMDSKPVNLNGWRLLDEGERHSLTLGDFNLASGDSCRVYTNQAAGCGNFGSGNPIWNNDGDCGYLYDTSGHLKSKRCYSNGLGKQ
jgi:hypothetical protein